MSTPRKIEQSKTSSQDKKSAKTSEKLLINLKKANTSLDEQVNSSKVKHQSKRMTKGTIKAMMNRLQEDNTDYDKERDDETISEDEGDNKTISDDQQTTDDESEDHKSDDSRKEETHISEYEADDRTISEDEGDDKTISDEQDNQQISDEQENNNSIEDDQTATESEEDSEDEDMKTDFSQGKRKIEETMEIIKDKKIKTKHDQIKVIEIESDSDSEASNESINTAEAFHVKLAIQYKMIMDLKEQMKQTLDYGISKYPESKEIRGCCYKFNGMFNDMYETTSGTNIIEGSSKTGKNKERNKEKKGKNKKEKDNKGKKEKRNKS